MLQKGYRLGDSAAAGQGDRRRVMANCRHPRRSQERLGRRDQEGLSQARPRAPSRPERRRRGALQGDPGRLRRALRPREAPGLRHVRHGERSGAQGGRSSRTSTSPISSAGFGGAARQRGPVPERGAGATTHTTLSSEDAPAAPRCACRSSSRPLVTAAQEPAPSRAPRPPSARSVAAAWSSPTPGAVLLAPVPALSRQRHHYRASL